MNTEQKIKIGEREYRLPFEFDNRDCCIYSADSDERLAFIYIQDKDENRHALGHHIASALNSRADEAERLKESVGDLLNAVKAMFPVVSVEPGSKEEALYLAYHKVKEVLK